MSQLMLTLDEVRGDNTALVIENTGLQDQVHQLMMELSEKEALWCEREEEMNKKLNEQWGEKYAEWISKVDHKMDELQQANAMLQGMLKKKKPPGPDPSGQDSS
ncbi:hypothetical protein LSAT2_014128 [Lamellibrachia satsuma]|nr:hypothetical protein LSAT2_014128 [Lamellibrachia satsuma]